MTRPSWAWTLLVGGAVLLAAGWYVLGFLAEPSAVDRVRTLMILIAGGSFVGGGAAVVAGVWILVGRRG